MRPDPITPSVTHEHTDFAGLKDMLDMINADLSAHYRLIYIARGACPVCKVYGPQLKRFAMQAKLAIVPLSSDVTKLAGWAKPVKPITGLKNPDRLTPMTALHNKLTSRVMLIGIGHLTSAELITRIHWLTRKEAGDAF